MYIKERYFEFDINYVTLKVEEVRVISIALYI